MVDPQLNQTVMNVFYYIREGADTAAYCTLVFGGACLSWF